MLYAGDIYTEDDETYLIDYAPGVNYDVVDSFTGVVIASLNDNELYRQGYAETGMLFAGVSQDETSASILSTAVLQEDGTVALADTLLGETDENSITTSPWVASYGATGICADTNLLNEILSDLQSLDAFQTGAEIRIPCESSSGALSFYGNVYDAGTLTPSAKYFYANGLVLCFKDFIPRNRGAGNTYMSQFSANLIAYDRVSGGTPTNSAGAVAVPVTFVLEVTDDYSEAWLSAFAWMGEAE